MRTDGYGGRRSPWSCLLTTTFRGWYKASLDGIGTLGIPPQALIAMSPNGLDAWTRVRAFDASGLLHVQGPFQVGPQVTPLASMNSVCSRYSSASASLADWLMGWSCFRAAQTCIVASSYRLASTGEARGN